MNSIGCQNQEGEFTFIGLDYLMRYCKSNEDNYVMGWGGSKLNDVRHYPKMKRVLDNWVRSFDD